MIPTGPIPIRKKVTAISRLYKTLYLYVAAALPFVTLLCFSNRMYEACPESKDTRVGTLIVATIYLQLIQNRYMFRSFTVLQCSHQHCVQPVASDVEVVGYL